MNNLLRALLDVRTCIEISIIFLVLYAAFRFLRGTRGEGIIRGSIVLFVVMAKSEILSEDLDDRIRRRIRREASPRHVPFRIVPVEAIPYTRSGKKVELAVAGLLCGVEPSNREALANPEALDAFREFSLDA